MGGFLPMIFQLAGYAIGGPVGAVIGSIVGAVLFGTQSGDSEGPRARDLKVQSSAYGTAIAIVYGCARLAGNIFWSSGIHEIVKRETSGGGILGGGATLTLYSYTTDLAIGICEGEIGEVRRIWANGRLIYDRTGTSDKTIPQGFQVTIYRGTEDQEPDPYMAANRDGKDIGGGLGVDGQPVAGPVPAYRGTAYVLIKNLDLEPFGNQVPSFEFEVVNGKPEPAVIERLQVPTGTLNGGAGQFAYDPITELIYVTSDGGTKLNAIDPVTFDVVREMDTNIGVNPWNLSQVTGQIYSSPNVPLSVSNIDIVVTDIHTGQWSGIDIALPNLDGNTMHSGPVIYNPLQKVLDRRIVMLTNGGLKTGSALYMLGVPAGGYEGGEYNYQSFTLPPGLDAFRLSTIEPKLTRGMSVVTSALIGQRVFLYSMPQSVKVYDEKILTGINHYWAYDSSRDRLWLAQPEERDGAVKWVVMFINIQGGPPGETPPPPHPTAPGWWQWKMFEPEEIGAAGMTAFAYNDTYDAIVIQAFPSGAGLFDGFARLYDVASAQLISETPLGQAVVLQQHGNFAHSTENYIITGSYENNANTLGKLFFGTPLSADGEDLAAIVSDLCTRAGLPPEDIDVSELTDKVKGYVVARPMTVRAAIEPLMSAYFFDGVETGGSGAP